MEIFRCSSFLKLESVNSSSSPPSHSGSGSSSDDEEDEGALDLSQLGGGGSNNAHHHHVQQGHRQMLQEGMLKSEMTGTPTSKVGSLPPIMRYPASNYAPLCLQLCVTLPPIMCHSCSLGPWAL